MATAVSANKAELIAIANAVATEKMIDKAIVIEAMEDAIQRAARSRSASRTFWKITCLAACAAMRPNSIGGSGSTMKSPTAASFLSFCAPLRSTCLK